MLKKILFGILAAVLLFWITMVLVFRPSVNRDWNADQAVLPEVTFSGDEVAIKNIRNINYRSTSDFDVRYYDKTFDLNKLESVWYMVEPFSGYGAGAAHTLLSFGFGGNDYVAVSVEIRKEKGEHFSAVKGLLRQYELTYVIADERDVIKLRSNYRKDKVFLYPVQTSKENMRKLFVSMLTRSEKLAKDPEFYNTLTSTCTTNIVSHVNEIAPGRIPFSFKVLMPAYSDELAQKIGIIDSSVPLEELRAKYLINERAEKYGDDPLFSTRIRAVEGDGVKQ
jgi:hypothetical protein